jgi:phage terminase large subunit-like protein
VDGHGYIVADRSCRLSPDGWGRRAVQAYLDFKADAIVVERNFGGDMAEAVVKAAALAMGVKVKVAMVTASRGKVLRAQPAAALYEQGRVHHTEAFTELEEQLTTWTPESGRSPDRLDALVWVVTETMLDPTPPAASERVDPTPNSYHAERRRRI